MSYDIGCNTISGAQANVKIDKYPDQCPICHTSVYPKFLNLTALLDNPHRIQSVFRCTKLECGQLFIGTYYKIDYPNFYLAKVEPIYPQPQSFPPQIQGISPTFVEVYNQAIAAEASNLSQLTGIGLRKALEFLVKDFAISQKPDQEDDIKSTFLGKCIDTFIDDPKIKKTARLATWLGNDETHYVRKWEDKDINDLKVLIKLTVNWIESSLLTEQYETDMGGNDDSV
jgi:hypothetical protein